MNIKTTILLGAVCATTAASQTVLATQATLVPQTALAIADSLEKKIEPSVAVSTLKTMSTVKTMPTEKDAALLKNRQQGMVTIADKVTDPYELITPSQAFINNSSDVASSDANNVLTIHRQGASFIKLHFSDFVIPDGVVVEVSNPEKTKVHTYSNTERSDFTFDAEAGDDGETSFSSLSIAGDTVVVNIITDGVQLDPARHKVNVDYYLEGYSEAKMLQALTDAEIRSTCGGNERVDAVCYQSSHPTEYDRSRPVGRLLMSNGGLCTAWRVGAENRVFTNNHCTASQSGVAAAEVWFNYQNTTCGGSTLEDVTVVSGSTLLETDATLDYTLFTVNNFSSLSEFGYLGLDPRVPDVGERIYIPQHGSGNPKELAIESDQNSGNLCRVDDESTAGNASGTDIGYYCDTIGGSSGSPVISAESNKVIALHHFGGCLNQGVQITRIWNDVSEHFSSLPDNDNGSGGDDGDDGDDTDTTPALSNGETVSGLSGSRSEWVYYKITVPAGASDLEISITGGSGDADLYTRYGSQPTTLSYDCRPYSNGNNETCSVSNPSTGEYYIGVRGYTAYSGVSLTASYSE